MIPADEHLAPPAWYLSQIVSKATRIAGGAVKGGTANQYAYEIGELAHNLRRAVELRETES